MIIIPGFHAWKMICEPNLTRPHPGLTFLSAEGLVSLQKKEEFLRQQRLSLK
jgi:hypothetical protein